VLPLKTASYIVPVSAADCDYPCKSNIKRARRRLDTCLIQFVTQLHMLQCSGQRVQWSVK